MRRSLIRATAVCATYALVLSLGGAATVTAGHKPSATTDGNAVPGERAGDPGGTASADGGARTSAGSRGASSAGAAFASVRSDEGRVETESSLWTYVDHAFPDRSHHGAETTSVGTGRLDWDRVYTRRALFRFPLALGSDTVVDSAVLRAEVVWSYDCASDSSLQLHQVDPFRDGVTWNDQPTERALLDTREVRGGRAACPVNGGVEFDVTEAVQWAVNHGEPHVHLRLAEGDESGSTGWRRFDVEDDPPVLVVDHSTPRTPGTDSGPTTDLPPDFPTDPRDGTADTGRSGDFDSVHGEVTPAPAPPRSAEGVEPFGVAASAPGRAAGVRVPSLDSDGRPRTGGDRARSQRGERADHPTAPDGHRQQVGDTVPKARGPPPAHRSEAGWSPVLRPREPADGRQHPSPRMRHPAGWRNASAAAREAGRAAPGTPWWALFRSGRGAVSSQRRPQGAVAVRGDRSVPGRREGQIVRCAGHTCGRAWRGSAAGSRCGRYPRAHGQRTARATHRRNPGRHLPQQDLTVLGGFCPGGSTRTRETGTEIRAGFGRPS